LTKIFSVGINFSRGHWMRLQEKPISPYLTQPSAYMY